MNIFLTNDDGYFSDGILSLARALSNNHRVTIVAPHKPQSAAAHALTMHKPLRIKYFQEISRECGAEVYSCSGKPADCVTIGILEVMKDNKPDLVISGINNGGNLATDVAYSGTVSGALEAAMMGYTAIAASVNSYEPKHMDTGVRVVSRLVAQYPFENMDNSYVLNVNIPDIAYDEIKGMTVVKQGKIRYHDIVTKGMDPFGNVFYWIGGTNPTVGDMDCDAGMIKNGYVTITPLTYMVTATDKMTLVEAAIKEMRE